LPFLHKGRREVSPKGEHENRTIPDLGNGFVLFIIDYKEFKELNI
jgi:hypothetical protein